MSSGCVFASYPNMSKVGTVGALAITIVVFGYHSYNSHSYANKAIVVDSDPDYVEPGKAALGRTPAAPFSSTAFLGPIHGPNPGLDWL